MVEMTPPMTPTVTTTEAARILGMRSPEYLLRCLRAGAFPGASKNELGRYLIPTKEVEEYLERREAKRSIKDTAEADSESARRKVAVLFD
jgi:hypothetical protein